VRRIVLAVILLAVLLRAFPLDAPVQGRELKRVDPKLFRAGASAVEIGPETFPVLVNGGFLQNRATRLNDPIHSKCIVLDDGLSRLAIVVVDSCMLPRELLDQAKKIAAGKTGISSERMLISATHTHSAPAAMGALGCPPDTDYAARLPQRIAESIERAVRNLEPARIGWGVLDDTAHTFCRRWIRRPDKVLQDPFGQETARANMHPGYQNPDAIAPAGPVDPGLTLLSIQSRTGRPIAVLSNYSMHYYGAEPVSADYFGRFATAFAQLINAERVDPPFVGMMSQGTSGDQMWMDYSQPKQNPGLDAYAASVARVAHEAYKAIAYNDWVPLAMAEAKLVLARRVPDDARLAWARSIISRMGTRTVPNSLPEVYAKEAIYLHEEPRRELKLQAVRIGELGVAAIPNEVFAITGLKIKAQSPFDTTMNIELANGSEGYIPPPEQHALGGYTTWPARTAGLEVQAEPKIIATMLNLLEKVADKSRRPMQTLNGKYSKAVLASRPLAYWRLDDIQGPIAVDESGNGRPARYEGGIAFFLPGANLPGFSAGKLGNRSVHFAGGTLRAALTGMGKSNSVELWFWNGLPNDARLIVGCIFSTDQDGTGNSSGGRLLIKSNSLGQGFLCYADAQEKRVTGNTEIAPKTWHHLVLTAQRDRLAVYLDGNPVPELDGAAPAAGIEKRAFLVIGAGSDGVNAFEGKIDEVSIYDRALPADEIVKHFCAAR
jgi:hypothetical protein